jgi:hypothetical protein
MKAKHLIIENNKVLVTGEDAPNKIDYARIYGENYVGVERYWQALQSWKDRAYEVENPEFVNDYLAKHEPMISSNTKYIGLDMMMIRIDGLGFEVKEEPSTPMEQTSYPSFKKVAVVTFKELTEKKCCKLNPIGCDDCTEFERLNKPDQATVNDLRDTRMLLKELWFQVKSKQKVSDTFLKTIEEFLADTSKI